MAKYIDKTVIEKILRKLWKEDKGYGYIDTARTSYNKALQKVQCEIDALEVKEVDLEEELKHLIGNVGQCDRKLAKHFFELGLKAAQKGE